MVGFRVSCARVQSSRGLRVEEFTFQSLARSARSPFQPLQGFPIPLLQGQGLCKSTFDSSHRPSYPHIDPLTRPPWPFK